MMRTALENGRGTNGQDVLAVWYDQQAKQQFTIVHVVYPPHEQPRGGILAELTLDAVRQKHPEAERLEFAHTMWGTDRELVFSDGRAGTAAFEANGWRVYT